MIENVRKIANSNKPDRWKGDIEKSVDMYNDWFMKFAPTAFRTTRIRTTKDVERALVETDYLRDVSAAVIRRWPGVLPTLRMSTCPPLAVDRLIGLSGVSDGVVKRIEKEQKLPVRLVGVGCGVR
jgi:XamI restriction endonuclease